MTAIPHFTYAELAVVRNTAAEGYGRATKIQVANGKIRPDHGHHAPVTASILLCVEQPQSVTNFELTRNAFAPRCIFREHEQRGADQEGLGVRLHDPH